MFEPVFLKKNAKSGHTIGMCALSHQCTLGKKLFAGYSVVALTVLNYYNINTTAISSDVCVYGKSFSKCNHSQQFLRSVSYILAGEFREGYSPTTQFACLGAPFLQRFSDSLSFHLVLAFAEQE